MIQSVRNIKLRIRSIDGTRKITRAMEMVAASKLNRVKSRYSPARAYTAKLDGMVRRLIAHGNILRHPLLTPRPEINKIGVLVITSDSGLCGSYNHSIIKSATQFIDDHGKDKVKVVSLGKDGSQHFKRHGYNVIKEYPETHGRYSDNLVEEVKRDLVDLYISGGVDQIDAIYMHFGSTLRHSPTIEKLLNIEHQHQLGPDYIIEPGRDELLNDLLNTYLLERIRLIILGAFTSEHSSRMIAMKTATDNADELINTLILSRNKARQAEITKEVLEIAMSAEVLKG